jgi:adhesin transport system outer membrane protein
LRYDALAAAASADTAASAFMPKVNIRLSLDYNAYEWNSDARTRTTTAMLSLRYDLYDGGVRAARERQARLRAEASKQDALIAVQEAENEIRKSWTAVSASAARCEPLLRRAAAARKALKLNSERFSAGKASLDTLLNLQNDAASSEVAYLNELSASRYHVYRLLAATGTLLPALGLRFSSIEALR